MPQPHGLPCARSAMLSVHVSYTIWGWRGKPPSPHAPSPCANNVILLWWYDRDEPPHHCYAPWVSNPPSCTMPWANGNGWYLQNRFRLIKGEKNIIFLLKLLWCFTAIRSFMKFRAFSNLLMILKSNLCKLNKRSTRPLAILWRVASSFSLEPTI